MLRPEGAVVPKSSVPGMNTKIVGRVKPVKAINKTAAEHEIIKKASVEHKEIEHEENHLNYGEKTASEKVAFPHINMADAQAALSKVMGTAGPIIRRGASTAAGAAGGIAGIALATKAINAISNFANKSAYDQAFARAIQLNPRLSSYPPDMLHEYYNIMISASPTVAKNPLIVANYLEYLIDNEGKLNFPAYEQLARVEGQALQNENNSNMIANSVLKGFTEGATKSMFVNAKRSPIPHP